jgi:PAS domain-containing protein
MTDRIRLLVDHDRNRELLGEWLADRYEVYTDAGEGAVEETDLCILDEAGFERHRERVTDWKDRADPVFAPVLLVAEGSYDDLDTETWESVDGLYVVDDIVVAPVEQGLLHRRLENLLSRRQLSTDLADSYRRSEERFASLFHAMPDPALVLSEGHVTYVNDAFCTQYGVDRDDTNWRHLGELAPLPTETVETVEAQVERAMERFDAVDVAETDAPGDGVDPVGTWTDERSDATAAGSVPGTGAESDATAAGTTGGEQHDSAAGSGTASAARTNDTASAASATDQDSETAPTDSSWGDDTETVVVETAAGEERYVETNVRPLTVDDRQSVALVMRDVTERRERKQRLERQNERLEEFASIVSHDLRNPLQVLGGRLQAIDAEREGDGAVTLDDHVPSMQRSVDRMRTLIDDLLTLARARPSTNRRRCRSRPSPVGPGRPPTRPTRTCTSGPVGPSPGTTRESASSSRTSFGTRSSTAARTSPSSSTTSRTTPASSSPTTAPGSPRTNARPSSRWATPTARTAPGSASASSRRSPRPTAGTSNSPRVPTAAHSSSSTPTGPEGPSADSPDT